jgi:hypothetical protein
VPLANEPEPVLYLVPSVEWIEAPPPPTDRDYEGKKSEPECEIEIGASSVAALRRYAWTEASATRQLGSASGSPTRDRLVGSSPGAARRP